MLCNNWCVASQTSLLANTSYRVTMPARGTGPRIQAKGLFPNAVVSRGHDWIWGDQDGEGFDL